MKKERYQQAADAAVAVEKRVDRLELDVRQRCFDERRLRRVLIVDETLEFGHAFFDEGWWRRNEMGRSRPRASDPVLRAPEFARKPFAASAARKKLGVHFPDKPVRKGKAFMQARHAVIQGGHIVRDFDEHWTVRAVALAAGGRE